MVERTEKNSTDAQAQPLLLGHTFGMMYTECAFLHLYVNEDMEEGRGPRKDYGIEHAVLKETMVRINPSAAVSLSQNWL